MFTLFTIPKPFTNPLISIIQNNAIQSWLELMPNIEIILVGNEAGVKEIAKKYRIKHIPQVKLSNMGTPLLDSAFSIVKKTAKNNHLCYINSDIILLDDFLQIINLLPQDNYLIVGQRWDLTINNKMNFQHENWLIEIRKNIMKSGKLHSPAGIDYFIFNKNSFCNIPAFAVGRIGWDNWMIREAREKNMKIIDATNLITAVHQNHEYSGVNAGASRKSNDEAKKNIELARGGGPQDYTIEDATHKIIGNKIKKNHLYWWPYIKRLIQFKLKSLRG